MHLFGELADIQTRLAEIEGLVNANSGQIGDVHDTIFRVNNTVNEIPVRTGNQKGGTRHA